MEGRREHMGELELDETAGCRKVELELELDSSRPRSVWCLAVDGARLSGSKCCFPATRSFGRWMCGKTHSASETRNEADGARPERFAPRRTFGVGRAMPGTPETPETPGTTPRGMTAWSDDETFWEAMEPALCAPARLSRAEADVAAILGAMGARPTTRVLDLACGPGAHAIGFARRGHRVTGVDASPRLLDRAHSAARAAGVEVEWVEADMREFRRPSGFDLACSLYTSFGYFDDAENLRVLEHLWASLAAGGALLLDVVGRETVARHWQERRWFEVDDALYLEHCTAAADWASMVSDWTVVRNSLRADFRVEQRLYTGTELRGLLLSLGFADVKLAGGLDGKTPYDESARRLVAMGRKPASHADER